MNMNSPRDSFYTKEKPAQEERKRIIRQGGKAYVRSVRHPKRGVFYRLRVQTNPT